MSRTRPANLKLLLRQEDIEHVGRGSRESLNDSPKVPGGSGPEAWKTELNRLRAEWEENRRQDLVMGAAAYGIALGVPPEKILEDLLALAEENEDPEIEQRQDAVNRTLSKHAQGERVAWRPYYQRAGLEPPMSKGPSSEVIRELEFLKTSAVKRVWKGKGGLTDRDIYLSSVEVSEVHGTPHEKGVEISISVRDLALRAKVSKRTVINSLKRLQQDHLIERASGGKGIESGSLVLLVDKEELQAYSEAEEENQQLPDTTSYTRLRYGPHKLGKLAGLILGVLDSHSPLTRPEIAKILNRKSRDLKVPLERLIQRELVEFDEESRCYWLPLDYPQVLFRELERDGTFAVEARDKKRFREEREAFYQRVMTDQVEENLGADDHEGDNFTTPSLKKTGGVVKISLSFHEDKGIYRSYGKLGYPHNQTETRM